MQPFVRDRFTWLAYGMLAYFSYVQSSLGPIMPFLREELRLSYTLGGLHVSAFALGMIVSGSIGDGIAAHFGRRLTFWGGAAGMAIGAASLATAPGVWLTLPSTFVMGLLGALLLAMIQASLSDRHGAQRAIAFTESNVIASIGAGLVPLLVGAFQTSGFGWRVALLLPALVIGGAVWMWGRNPLPERKQQATHTARAGTLPIAFWGYFVVIVLAVAVEWSVVVWGADFLEKVVNIPKSLAATAMTCFFMAQLVGRFVGSRLTRTVTSEKLLLIALGIALVGFPLFWLAPTISVALVGLTILGLGVANLYPLTLSVAVGVAAEQADTASSRIVMGGGLAILTAPIILGSVADRLDIQQAFAIVALLIGLATVVTFISGRLATRQSVGQTKQAAIG